MSARPKDSQALAALLEREPPVLDDLARARLEKRVVAAAMARAPRSRRVVWIAGASAALAAAAALAFVLLRGGEPERPVVFLDLHERDAAMQRGTLEQGSLVRTDEDEEADLSIGDSRLRLGGGSQLRLSVLAPDHLGFELIEGVVRVAFHPRERGRERMTIETPNARVEVVGTVFRVEVSGRGTRVSVSEGVVRVVPLDGSAARLVRAGEHTTVPAEARAERASEAEPAASDVGQARSEGEELAQEATGEPEEVAQAGAPADPAARLEAAKQLIERGRAAPAARILRELTRPGVPLGVRVDAWITTGDLERNQGRLDAAERAYEQAALIGRGRLDGHNAIYLLARLHQQRGDRAAARATYERYLREAPDGVLAAQARAALARLAEGE